MAPPTQQSSFPETFTDSFSSDATQEHCPVCRTGYAAQEAARLRAAAAFLFARQVRLELEELAALLGVELPGVGS